MKDADKPPCVHNAVCDNCKEQIIGMRYKCNVCGDYDLCEECERKKPHNPEHTFTGHSEDIVNPQRPPLSAEEKTAQLKK